MTIQGYNLSAILNGIVQCTQSNITLELLLNSINLKINQLENKKDYLDWYFLANTLEQARLLSGDEHIGLSVGKNFSPIGFGPEMGFYLQVCPDIQTAAKGACESGEIIGGVTKFFYLEDTYDSTIGFNNLSEWKMKQPESYRVCSELNVAASLNIVSFLSRGLVTPHKIVFEHKEEKEMLAVYKGFFGSHINILFSQPYSGIVFYTEKMKTPNPAFDENAYQNYQQQLNLRKNQVNQQVTYSENTTILLRESLFLQREELSLESIAQQFFLSPRSLQRFFEKENTSWNELRNKIRKEWIIENIDYQSNIQISDFLKFSSSSNFNRWFKNEFAVTPDCFRANPEKKYNAAKSAMLMP